VAEAATYTTYTKHKRRTVVPSAGFEPAIPVIKRLQTYALDRTVTGIDNVFTHCMEINLLGLCKIEAKDISTTIIFKN
jgi:hypothetical protein